MTSRNECALLPHMSAERTEMQAELLTATQVAERFGINRSTVSRWGLRGVLPVVRVGKGFVRYRRDDVERLLESEAS